MKKTNIKLLIISLVILIITVLGTLPGCITINRPESSESPESSSPTETSVIPTPINPSWTPPPTANQTEELPSIADVVALVKPSVVAITTEVIGQSIFGQFTEEGAGSGWIIDEDGIIVTNNHVIEGASTITVTLDDGSTYTADIDSVATDTLNDLAILKIDAHGLPALKRGNSSELRVGDWVVAIGNALGQGIRATEGIVSRKEVSLTVSRDQTLYELIETSAAINPGNSGGPLVNLRGEVVGITSAKIAQVGVEGMGYAISIDTSTPIIQQLVTKGYVTRAWLGVVITTLSQAIIAAIEEDPTIDWEITVDKGILLVDTAADGPAAQAGLMAGDVIVSLGGKETVDEQEFIRVLHSSEVGQSLEITYWRGDKEDTVTVIPIESPQS
jgi:serine protease Do